MDFDRRAFLILVWVPIGLAVLHYLFLPSRADDLFDWAKRTRPGSRQELWKYFWWSGGCLAVMVVVPSLLLWFGARTSPRELGLRVKGTGKDAYLYAAMFLVFAPVVWLFSRDDDFQRTYPFFKPPRGMSPQEFVGSQVFWLFEAAYFLQFFSIEYFFRGFMVLGLKPAFGRASILVMLAPYCMIHFQKPMPEAFGAIGAGLVLGTLSWRTRTVLYGWFLHYAVALSMDLLALHQRAPP